MPLAVDKRWFHTNYSRVYKNLKLRTGKVMMHCIQLICNEKLLLSYTLTIALYTNPNWSMIEGKLLNRI